MPAWKVLLIMLLAVVFFGLVIAAVLVPMSMTGNDRWAWLGGLVPGALLVGGLLVLFMRQAGKSM
ncbi:MAG: hypothetical protein K2X87_15245 [Gemmataceae bacterium]|nr:hypothetical protein [Gemmataceae bacterium]